MLTCFQSILSDVHYTTATRDSLTALRRLCSPVSYVRLQRTLCGVCTPLNQRGRDVRLDRPVRGDGRSTPCAGWATVFVHSCTGRGTRRAKVARKTWGKATASPRTVKEGCKHRYKNRHQRHQRMWSRQNGDRGSGASVVVRAAVVSSSGGVGARQLPLEPPSDPAPTLTQF